MDDPITNAWIQAAHEEWRLQEENRLRALKLWGRGFEAQNGPQRFRDWVDAEKIRLEHDRERRDAASQG